MADDLAGRSILCPHCERRVTLAEPQDDVIVAELVEPVRRERTGFRCPFCQTREAPTVERKTTSVGWGLFWLLVLSVAGILVCWVGLLIKEETRRCSSCGIKLG